ncbi:MAG: phenylacetate--CoA ligase [Planctomycetia bacterium]|nr:phenylacetate--CoA ligase [Planctomycetia bacterium]
MAAPLFENLPFENLYWSQMETLPREQMRVLQLERLKKTVDKVRNLPMYREFFEKTKLTGDDIHSLDDVRKLPFTTKKDLLDQYPFGHLLIPRHEIVRIHGSSGTKSKPTLTAYTKNDLVTWADLTARFLYAGGLRSNHLVQIAFGYGLFTGGFGLHYGIERIGAGILPSAAGNTPRQIMFLQDLRTDCLIATPSYAMNIAETVRDMGIKPDELPLKFAHFGAEAWTDEMRKTIEQLLGIKAYNNYGLSEIMGPSVSGECYKQDGMHIQEDCFLVECLHPETLEPVAEGEPGEIVITNLQKEATSLLRYRTRDIATITSQPCECGRTTTRMSRIVGRSDDMVVIRGVNLFPSQIEEALLRVPGATPHYLIQVTRPGSMDEVTVQVEIQPDYFSDKMSEMEQLRSKILHEIQIVTGLRVKLELQAPQTMQRFQGKAKRLEDLRDLYK